MPLLSGVMRSGTMKKTGSKNAETRSITISFGKGSARTASARTKFREGRAGGSS